MLLDQLRKDKMTALKEKDSLKNGICSLLISAMSLKEKEDKKTLSDEDALLIVQRELKQTKETLSMTPPDRVELIEETNKKIAIIESYLPKQLTKDELIEKIQAIADEKSLELVMKNRGIIMKEVMSKFVGQTDGKTVNQVISEILK